MVTLRRRLPLPRRRRLPPRVLGRLPASSAAAAQHSALLRRQCLFEVGASLSLNEVVDHVVEQELINVLDIPV